MTNNYGNSMAGNSIDIHMDNDNSVEIRADVRVDEFNSKRLWGQILNTKDQPVGNSLVKLVKVTCVGGKKHYEGIAHTNTDCEGFYQFDICADEPCDCYKVVVNKAVTGPEKVLETHGGNCYRGEYVNGPNGEHYPVSPCEHPEPYRPDLCAQGGPCSCQNHHQPMPCPCQGHHQPALCPPHGHHQPIPYPCEGHRQQVPMPCPQPEHHQPVPCPCHNQPMPYPCQGHQQSMPMPYPQPCPCQEECHAHGCKGQKKAPKTNYATYTR